LTPCHPPVFTGAGSANAGVSYLIIHNIMRKIDGIPAGVYPCTKLVSVLLQYLGFFSREQIFLFPTEINSE